MSESDIRGLCLCGRLSRMSLRSCGLRTSSWPGLLYGPETSPTGVRGHDRHIIIAWNRLQGRPSMPWREVWKMEQRREFVRLAMQEGVNRRELCRRFEIHPDPG